MFHLAGRGAFDIEVLGYKAAVALLDAKVITDEGDLFALDADKLARSPFFVNKDGIAGQQRAASCWPTWTRSRAGRCGGCWWRCRSGTSGRPPPRRWPGEFGSIEAIEAADARRSCPPSTGSGRRSRQSVKEWFAVDWHREIVASGAEAGVRMAEERSRRPARARWKG